MIPIPDYLKQYASELQQKGSGISFKLRCTCGCKSFVVLDKSYTEDKKRLIKEYEDSCPDVGWHSIHGGIGPDGKPCHYIKILGLFRKNIAFPEAPACMNINAVKACCAQCSSEIILFDNRYHGYDGMISDYDEEREYILHFSQKSSEICKLEIVVENAPSIESFCENTEEQCSHAFYSNAFSRITIYTVNEDGRKKQLYDFETA